MKTLYHGAALFFIVGIGKLNAQSLLDTTRIAQTDVEGDTPVSSNDAEQINDEIDKLFDDDLDMGWEGDEFNVATCVLSATGAFLSGRSIPSPICALRQLTHTHVRILKIYFRIAR